MPDFPVQSSPNVITQAEPPVSATLVVYLLFAITAVAGVASHGIPVIAPLMGLVGIVAVIIAYVKRSDARGTWTESHLTWLIRTFWWSLAWGLLCGLVLVTLGLILIGIPIAFGIWAATTIWVIYRLVRGYLYFKDSKPIPGV